MADFLTRRNGTWHFVRRVPIEFAAFDRRGVVRHSTKVRVSEDRTGRRALRVADKLNSELEAYWHLLLGDKAGDAAKVYENGRLRARSMGFEYIENSEIVSAALEKIVERLEALGRPHVGNDAGARAAVLGTLPKPSFPLSKLLEEYEALIQNQLKRQSPNQLRVWRGGRARVVREFIDLVGDKQVTELTHVDGMDYRQWYLDRVVAEEVKAQSANKSIGMLSRMLRKVNLVKRLDIPEIFKGMKLDNVEKNSRPPFDPEFIQDELLAAGALDGLNEDARLILYVMADTGLRIGEVCNLRTKTIHLDTPIPYVEVLPDGRVTKTADSVRQIPLVGVVLAAMKLRPDGFARYRDKSSSHSALVNKYLDLNGLRPTKQHAAYSLRHSFKDRLVAAEAPDSIIDYLMGHKTGKQKYGHGPSLELKLKWLELIAFTPPSRLCPISAGAEHSSGRHSPRRHPAPDRSARFTVEVSINSSCD